MKQYAFRAAGWGGLVHATPPGKVTVLTGEGPTLRFETLAESAFFRKWLPDLRMDATRMAAELLDQISGRKPHKTETSPAVRQMLDSLLGGDRKFPPLNNHDHQVMYARDRKPGHERQVALNFSKKDGKRASIVVADGVYVETLSEHEFQERYIRSGIYSMADVAALFRLYAIHRGATKEALAALGTIVTLSKEDIQMAASSKRVKNVEAPAAPAEAPANETPAADAATQENLDMAKDKTAAKKAAAPKKATKASKAAVQATKAANKKAAAAKTANGRAPMSKGDGTKGSRRTPATAMICELIMANAKLPEAKKLTDNEIFAKVQAKYGLDEKKRVYVGWYRGQMKREGVKNVPEAVRGR